MVKIDTKPIDSLTDLTSDPLFIKKKFTIKDCNSKYSFTIQPHNLICTCEIRIRETSKYLNELQIRRQNECGEAFSFYEIVNCISIVLGCTKSLFNCFEKELNREYGDEKIFKKSNRKKKSDINFFDFIRSASSVHPEKTDRHKKLTKSKHEFYPYAVWRNEFALDSKAPKDLDVELVYWNSKPNCYSRAYYLYLEEFFLFANRIVSLISKLNPLVQNVIDREKRKMCCKRLKNASKFKTRTEYCLYLRERLKKRKMENSEDDFLDGGLLVASHMLSNRLLDDEFKDFIYERVEKIAKKMCEDITEIGPDDIYGDLSLNVVFSTGKDQPRDCDYVVQKFHEYLDRETKDEIKANSYRSFLSSLREEENNMNYDDAEWATRLLLSSTEGFYNADKIKKAYSFADLYEITLETIWEKMKEKGMN